MAKKPSSKKASWIPKRDLDKLMQEAERLQLYEIIKDIKPTSIGQTSNFNLSKRNKNFLKQFERQFPKIEWP